MRIDANVRIVSSWRHEMPELYDVLPRQHVPMVQLSARMPSIEPAVNFTTPVERGYTTDQAITESTRCLMCNYNIWFDPFRCVLCGACADVCPEGVIHMIDVNQMKSEGAAAGAGGRLRLEPGRRDGPGRGALHPLRAVRQAMPVRRHHDGPIRTAGDQQDGRLYKESYRDTQLGLAGTRQSGRSRGVRQVRAEMRDAAVRAQRSGRRSEDRTR